MSIFRAKPYVVPIAVRELTKRDMENLDKALKVDYDGNSRDEVLDKAIAGFCQIWRLGDSEGIVVTEIIQRDEGLYLWLPLLGGKGVFKKLDELETALVKYGQEKGCAVIRWASLHIGTQKVYSKRWKEIARIYERSL